MPKRGGVTPAPTPVAPQSNGDIQVLVGVEGNTSVDRGTGKLISDTLRKIIANINNNPPTLVLDIDIDRTVSRMQKSLDEVAKRLSINISGKLGSIGATNENGTRGGASGKASGKAPATTNSGIAFLNAVTNNAARNAMNAYQSSNAADAVKKAINSAVDKALISAGYSRTPLEYMFDEYSARAKLTSIQDKYGALTRNGSITKSIDYINSIKANGKFDVLPGGLQQSYESYVNIAGQMSSIITGLNQSDKTTEEFIADTAALNQLWERFLAIQREVSKEMRENESFDKAVERAKKQQGTIISEYGRMKGDLQRYEEAFFRLDKDQQLVPGNDKTTRDKWVTTKDAMEQSVIELKAMTDGTQALIDKTAEVSKQWEDFKRLTKSVKTALNNDLSWDKVRKQAEQYDEQIRGTLSRSKKSTAEWEDILYKIRTKGYTTPNVALEELIRFQNYVHSTGLDVESLGQKIKRMFSTKAGYAAVTSALMLVRRAAREAIQTIVELDTAFTQLKIVSGATSAELKRVSNDIYDSAQRIGAGVTELTDAVTTYSRLGFTLSESVKLGEYTTAYSKLSGVDISEAESAITAVVKAYDVGAADIEKVLSKIIKVGNSFAISQAEIGTGLNNTASALVAGNNTFEKSLGLLTAAQTTTQDISKSSTALRTIAARITNTTAVLDELGETLDSGYDTVAKYRKQLLALTGVDIQKANGEFRSTYDILDDLSEVWKTLGSDTQAAVTTMLAGTRNVNVFASLMQNFDEARNVVATASTESGAYAEALNIYLDSIQGKLQQLKDTTTEMIDKLVNSDIIKGALSGINGVLSFANDNLGSIVALIGSIIVMAKSQAIAKAGMSMVTWFKNAGQSASQFFTNIRQGQSVLNLTKIREEAIAATTKKLTEQNKTLTDATKRLTDAQIAQQAAAAGTAAVLSTVINVAMAVVAVISIISTVGSQIEAAAKRRAEESRREAEAARDAVDSVNQLVNSYNKLAEAKADGEWSAEQLSEVESIQEQINKLQRDIAKDTNAQATAIDLVNGKLDDEKGKLEDIAEETREAARIKAKQALVDAEKVFNGIGSPNDAEWYDPFSIIKAAVFELFIWDGLDVENKAAEYRKLERDRYEMLKQYSDDDLSSKKEYNDLNEWLEENREAYEAYQEALDWYNELSADNTNKGGVDQPPNQPHIGIEVPSKEKMSDALTAITTRIQKEIDALNKEKKALQDANKEREKAIKLLDLEDAKRRALTDRTRRVWYADRGWVLETDIEAVKSAQEALDDFNGQEAIDALDAQIQSLENYKSSWSDIADEVTQAQNEIILAEVLGADWEETILDKRIAALDKFRAQYRKAFGVAPMSIPNNDYSLAPSIIAKSFKDSESRRRALEAWASFVPMSTTGGFAVADGETIYISNLNLDGVNDVEEFIRELKKISKNR